VPLPACDSTTARREIDHGGAEVGKAVAERPQSKALRAPDRSGGERFGAMLIFVGHAFSLRLAVGHATRWLPLICAKAASGPAALP
jgi:hypothetical protein